MANKKIKRRKLTQQHTVKLGTMQIVKGDNGEGQLTYTWDTVQKCRLETCPAALHCHYLASLVEGDDCKIMKKYLRSVSLVLYEGQGNMSSAQRYQIGMHIIPLYKTLCKMKIEELGIVEAVSMTSRGTMQVNPIYKEIREIIKVIDQTWKSIGVKAAVAPTVPGFSKKPADGGNYYDAMEAKAFAAMDDKVTPIRKES